MTPAPADLVIIGRVRAPFGVRGWVNVDSMGGESATLLRMQDWWLGNGVTWRAIKVAQCKPHGASVVAQLDGVEDRVQADALKHLRIAVPRNQLPPAESGEYYWHDLQGLAVVNLEGEALGEVVDLIETGANKVLVVRGEKEVLVPFLAHVVSEVDLDAKLLKVDWQADY